MRKKFKILILFLVLVFIIGGIIGGITIRSKYVILENKLYKKDVKEIYVKMNNTKISEINRCTDLELLSLWNMDSHSFETIKVFSDLRQLELCHFDSEISGLGIEKINLFPKLESLYFVDCDVDLYKFDNNSVKELCIDRANIKDLKAISDCSSLSNLILNHVTMDNGKIVAKSADSLLSGSFLKNSSDFAVLDNIKILRIFGVQVEDISGILEMDSLKTLEVDKGNLSEDDKKVLEDKGISVIEDTDSD